jgi:hypothetical protein
MRLLLPVFAPDRHDGGRCPCNHGAVLRPGKDDHHWLHCPQVAGAKVGRHNTIVSILHDLLSRVHGVTVFREVTLPDRGSITGATARADLAIHVGPHVKYVDVSVCSVASRSAREAGSNESAGAAAREREERKIRRYQGILGQAYSVKTFYPFVVECTGHIGSHGIRLLDDLGLHDLFLQRNPRYGSIRRSLVRGVATAAARWNSKILRLSLTLLQGTDALPAHYRVDPPFPADDDPQPRPPLSPPRLLSSPLQSPAHSPTPSPSPPAPAPSPALPSMVEGVSGNGLVSLSVTLDALLQDLLADAAYDPEEVAQTLRTSSSPMTWAVRTPREHSLDTDAGSLSDLNAVWQAHVRAVRGGVDGGEREQIRQMTRGRRLEMGEWLESFDDRPSLRRLRPILLMRDFPLSLERESDIPALSAADSALLCPSAALFSYTATGRGRYLPPSGRLPAWADIDRLSSCRNFLCCDPVTRHHFLLPSRDGSSELSDLDEALSNLSENISARLRDRPPRAPAFPLFHSLPPDPGWTAMPRLTYSPQDSGPPQNEDRARDVRWGDVGD